MGKNVIFKVNKDHMTKEAKKAAKKEKNLKILLGGYQVEELFLTIVLRKFCILMIFFSRAHKD